VKVLLDAVGCRHDGVTTYWTNLTRQWALDHPADELRVVRASTDDEWTIPGVAIEDIRVPRPDVLARPLALTRALRGLARSWRPDAVLAARPSTTVRPVGAPLAVVVHDLRHELRPDQFSRGRRLVRRISYDLSFAAADGFICISQRTEDDLLRLHPRLRKQSTAVIHHGADHTDGWPHGRVQPSVVAFGHHANKNVDLVLDAWRDVVATSAPGIPRLTVLGLGTQRRAELDATVRALGLADHVTLSAFLDDDDFHAVMADSVAVLYPSDFEGFGFPVVEAMRLGKAVVVSPDPAVHEVAQGHAFAMSGWAATALATAIRAALSASAGEVAAARRHAETFTWSRTVAQTRDFLRSLSAGGRASS
jgi:glycosyltransferase involved in cell wall biosynthesis